MMSASRDGFLDIMGDAAAHLFEDSRHQRGGPAQRDLRAEFGQRPDIGAGDAAVKNIAQDGDVQPRDLPFLFANGESIQQRLRGMFVRAVAGIDDAGIEDARQEMRRAGRAVANDDEIGIERFQIARGVFQRLAFFERGSFGGEIDDVGGKPLLGKFETDARAGGRFDEKIDDRFAAQGRDFFDGAFADGFESARGIEDGDDFLGG